MKLPKIIEELNWKLTLGDRRPVDSLKYFTFTFDKVEGDFLPDTYSMFTAEAKISVSSMISKHDSQRIYSDKFNEIPVVLRRSLLRELYGDVVDELRSLCHELYEIDIQNGSKLVDKLHNIISILETGEED